jgi:hypothetical protein
MVASSAPVTQVAYANASLLTSTVMLSMVKNLKSLFLMMVMANKITCASRKLDLPPLPLAEQQQLVEQQQQQGLQQQGELQQPEEPLQQQEEPRQQRGLQQQEGPPQQQNEQLLDEQLKSVVLAQKIVTKLIKINYLIFCVGYFKMLFIFLLIKFLFVIDS